MPLKGNEQPAAERLKQWLLEAGHPSIWVPVKADPPDLVFEVEGLGRWAVEVTEMQEYFGQQTGQGVKPKEAIAAQKHLHAVVDRIKARFVGRELLFRYYLYLEGPIDKEQTRQIESAVITFIESGEEGNVLLGTEEDIELSKVASNIKTLAVSNHLPGKIYGYVGLGPTTTGGDGSSYLADIEASHAASINRILQAKLPKLGKLTGYDRRVLLIWNSYFFGDERTVTELLGKAILPSGQIDCIFLVVDDNVHLVANPGGVLI